MHLASCARKFVSYANTFYGNGIGTDRRLSGELIEVSGARTPKILELGRGAFDGEARAASGVRRCFNALACRKNRVKL